MKLQNAGPDRIREVLSVLMESSLYFDIPLRERLELVKQTMTKL
jgi:hypothetical protein